MASFGRGRGRGWKPETGRPELDESIKITFTETPLFPLAPECVKIEVTSDEQLMLEYDDALLKLYRKRQSIYYRREPQPQQEIQRYSDKFKIKQQTNQSLHSLPTALKYFPTELHATLGGKLNFAKTISSKEINWETLTKAEKDHEMKKATSDVNDDDVVVEEEYNDEDEEGCDYLIDHYDEDYDSGGGESDGNND